MLEDKRPKQYTMIAVLLVALIIIMIVFFIVKKAQISEGPDGISLSGATEETSGDGLITNVMSFSGETISSEIRDMGELVTADYYYKHAESYEHTLEAMGIRLSMTTTGFTYTVKGEIKAGIDCSAVTVETDTDAKKIVITLPKPKIVSSEIDHNSFELVDEKNGLFNSLSSEEVNKTFQYVKDQEEAEAIENGLLDRAGENAEQLIGSAIRNVADTGAYTIEFAYAEE